MSNAYKLGSLSLAISLVIWMHERRGFGGHSVGVPRGMLYHSVLRMLDTSVMSGSEIAEELERRTGWRPSPGSIYPLLGRMKERGLVVEVESGEPGLKRFGLTDRGREMLKEHVERSEAFAKKFHSIRSVWNRMFRGMDEEMHVANMRLLEAVEALSPYLKGEGAKEARGVIRLSIVKAAEELEALKKRLESEKKE